MTRPAALRLGVPARGMLTHRTLAQLLAPDRLVPGRRRDVDVLLAWGRRPSALRVERLAQRWDLPVWHLEDGLLRSMAKGRDHPPLALLVDDLGVHFDATVPSRIEQLIAAPITAAEADRARALQRLWCEQRLSKVNPPLGGGGTTGALRAGGGSIRWGSIDRAWLGRRQLFSADASGRSG